MPADLLYAHQDNDRAVMQVYGFDPKTMDDKCRSSWQNYSNVIKNLQNKNT